MLSLSYENAAEISEYKFITSQKIKLHLYDLINFTVFQFPLICPFFAYLKLLFSAK